MYTDALVFIVTFLAIAAFILYVFFNEKAKERRASPFPLFKITEEEADVLVKAYNMGWKDIYLCSRFYDLGVSRLPIKKKVQKSLGRNYTLTGWRYKQKGILEDLSHREEITLRKQWIVALLIYNNYQSLVEKL